jgi:hypothetical protein
MKPSCAIPSWCTATADCRADFYSVCLASALLVRLQPGAQFVSLAKLLARGERRWWTVSQGDSPSLSPAFCPSQQRHIAHRPLLVGRRTPGSRGSIRRLFASLVLLPVLSPRTQTPTSDRSSSAPFAAPPTPLLPLTCDFVPSTFTIITPTSSRSEELSQIYPPHPPRRW